MHWIEQVFTITQGQVIAIDGKTARHSYDNGGKKGAIHLVKAWASKNGITLGQRKVDEKSNEITAIPELPDLLNLDFIHLVAVVISRYQAYRYMLVYAVDCRLEVATKFACSLGQLEQLPDWTKIVNTILVGPDFQKSDLIALLNFEAHLF